MGHSKNAINKTSARIHDPLAPIEKLADQTLAADNVAIEKRQTSRKGIFNDA